MFRGKLLKLLTLTLALLIIASLIPTSIIISEASSSNYILWFSSKNLKDFIFIQAFKYRRWPDRKNYVFEWRSGGKYYLTDSIGIRKSNEFQKEFKKDTVKLSLATTKYYFEGVLPSYREFPSILKRVRKLSPYYPLYAIYEPLNEGNELNDGTQVTIPKGESVIIALGPRPLMSYLRRYLSGATFEAEVSHPLSNYSLVIDIKHYKLIQYAALLPLYLRSRIDYLAYYAIVRSRFNSISKELPKLPPTLNPYGQSSIVIVFEVLGSDGVARVFIAEPSRYVHPNYFMTVNSLAKNKIRGLHMESTVPIIQPSWYFMAGNKPLSEGSKGVLILREDRLACNYLIVTINPSKYSGTFRIRFKAYIVPRGKEYVVINYVRYGVRTKELMKYPVLKELTLTFKVGPEYWRILEGSREVLNKKSDPYTPLYYRDVVKAEIVGYGWFGEAILKVSQFEAYSRSFSYVLRIESLGYYGVIHLSSGEGKSSLKVITYFPVGGATPFPSGAPIVIKSPKVIKYVGRKYSFRCVTSLALLKYANIYYAPCGTQVMIDKWLHPNCLDAYDVIGYTNLWLTYPLYQYKYVFIEAAKFQDALIREEFKISYYGILLYTGAYLDLMTRLAKAISPSGWAVGGADYRVPPNWWGVLGVNERNDYFRNEYLSVSYGGSIHSTSVRAHVLFSILDIGAFGNIRVIHFGRYDRFVIEGREPPPQYLVGINQLTSGGIAEGAPVTTEYVAGKFIKPKEEFKIPKFVLKTLTVFTNKVYYSPGEVVKVDISVKEGEKPLVSNSLEVVVTIKHKYLRKGKVLLKKNLRTDSRGNVKLTFKLPTYDELAKDFKGKSPPTIISIEIYVRDLNNKVDGMTSCKIIVGAALITVWDVYSLIDPMPGKYYPLIKVKDRFIVKSVLERMKMTLVNRFGKVSSHGYSGTAVLNIYRSDTGELVKSLRLKDYVEVLRLPLGTYSAEVIVKLSSKSGNELTIKSQLYNFTIDETIFYGSAPVVDIDIPVSILTNALYVESQLEKLKFTDTDLVNAFIASIKAVTNKVVTDSTDFMDQVVIITKSLKHICESLSKELGYGTFTSCSKYLNYILNIRSEPINYLSKLVTIETPIKSEVLRKYLEPYLRGSKRLPIYNEKSLTNPDTFWSRVVRATVIEAVVINRYYTSVNLLQKGIYYGVSIGEDVLELLKLLASTLPLNRPSIEVIDVKALKKDLVSGTGPYSRLINNLKALGGNQVVDKLINDLVNEVSNVRKDLVSFIVGNVFDNIYNYLINDVLYMNVTSKLMKTKLVRVELGLINDLKNNLAKVVTIIASNYLDKVSALNTVTNYGIYSAENPPLININEALATAKDEVIKLGMKVAAHYVLRNFIKEKLVPFLIKYLKESLEGLLDPKRHNARPTYVVLAYVNELTSFVGDVDDGVSKFMGLFDKVTNPLNSLSKATSAHVNYYYRGYRALESSSELLRLVKDTRDPISPFRGSKLGSLMSELAPKVLNELETSTSKLSRLVSKLRKGFGSLRNAGKLFSDYLALLIIIYGFKIAFTASLAYSSWHMGSKGSELLLKSIYYEVKGVPVVNTLDVVNAYSSVFKYLTSIAPGTTLTTLSSAGTEFELPIKYSLTHELGLPTKLSLSDGDSFTSRLARLKEVINRLGGKYLVGSDAAEAIDLIDSMYLDTELVITALSRGYLGSRLGIDDLSRLLKTTYVLNLMRSYIIKLTQLPNSVSSNELTFLTNSLNDSVVMLDNLMVRLRSLKGINKPLVVIDGYVSSAGTYSLRSNFTIVIKSYSLSNGELTIKFTPLSNVAKLGREVIKLKYLKGLHKYSLSNYLVIKDPMKYGIVRTEVFIGNELVGDLVIKSRVSNNFKKVVVGDVIITYSTIKPKVFISRDSIRLSNLVVANYLTIYIPKRGGNTKPKVLTSPKAGVNIIDLGNYFRINVIYNESINELVIKYPRATESYIADLREGKIISESTGEVVSPTKELMRRSVTVSTTSLRGTTKLSTSTTTELITKSTLSTSTNTVKGKGVASNTATYVLLTTALLTSLAIAYLIVRRRLRR